MKVLRPGRPSASMVVALLALVVALGGTAVAGTHGRLAGLISGAKIKPRSIAGNRLKPDTVTGAQIKEGTLRLVPSATVALEATHAATATTAKTAGEAAFATKATSADHATSAETAGTAAHAASAETAARAASAATATDATELGGIAAGDYLTSGQLVRYSAAMQIGDPQRALASVGPITFTASCTETGGETIAALGARADADGVSVKGTTLASGESVTVQTVREAGPAESFLPIITATDAGQSFAVQGVPVIIVNTLGEDCRFFGTLIDDAG